MLQCRFHTDHAEDQILSRYLYEPTPADWRAAFLDIVDRRSCLLARQRDGIERHIVRVGNVAVVIVYDPATATMITVLPPNARCRRA